MGFPTANINLWKKIPEGVYISITKINNKNYNSLTFIGRAKTFNENKYHAETYIFNFNQNIYNRWISIKLIKKIRDNKKFNSADELIEQMKKDKKIGEEYFKE